MNNNNISEINLLRIGFIKQYSWMPNGFYLLRVNNKFYFTVNYKTMQLSIGLQNYGHIQVMPNIKTISQIKELFYILTGTNLIEDNAEDMGNRLTKPKFIGKVC